MTGLGRDESCSCVLLIAVGTAGLVPLGSCSKDAPSEALGLQLPPHLPSDCQEGWGPGTEVGHWGGGGTLGAEVGHWEQRWDTGDRAASPSFWKELFPPSFGFQLVCAAPDWVSSGISHCEFITALEA